jgi:XTP/dITP diphosphohydrolase
MTQSRRVVLATGNPGKVRELQQLLGPTWTVVPQADCGVVAVEETGSTFIDNALLKAHHAARITGLPAIADDSGLEVDALGGAPGVRSARFAGPDATDAANVKLLLERLGPVADPLRSARFRCCMVYVERADDPRPLIGEGCWEGRIALAPRGDSGFGYDPVFEDPDLGLTAAELPPTVKNERSHRARAWRELGDKLAALA